MKPTWKSGAPAALHGVGVLLFAAGLAARPATAAPAVPYVYPYNYMTAQELVTKLLVKPKTDSDYEERNDAYAYVNGIKDGTQGTVWCLKPGLKPDELIYQTVHAVERNNAPEALKANAAGLVLKELRRAYPCAAVRKDPP